MGWLWSSSSSPKLSADQHSGSSFSSPTTANSPESASSHTSAPNEPVDPEIQKFFDLLNKPEPPPSSKPSSDSSPNFLSSWLSSKSSSSSEPLPPVPRLDAISESLLPTEMSCRQAFDLAWSCNSLGGQWNAVYRQGEMRSCSHLWDDFWFCMRTKSYSGTIKENTIQEHYRRKEYEKYFAPGRPSSEDIWEARTTKMQQGTAFAEGIEIPTVNDDEWRRQEEERRKKIRQDLGFEKTS